jgi:DNA-binding response OmpR family regulator
MREPAVVDRLRRSLLRYNIWCAPCSRRDDLVTTLRAVAFSCVVLDLEDALLDATDALPVIATMEPGLPRIGLTASHYLREELAELVEALVLRPVEMGELTACVRRHARRTSELGRAQGA